MKKSTSKVLKLDKKSKRIAIFLMKPFANKFILLNMRNKAKKNCVNINYWSGKPNLGDAISPLIVEYMLSLKNIDKNKKVNGTKHLYAVGSVITAGIQDCTIWGSGILYSTLGYRIKNRNLDIRSVRGPLTRVVLKEYGYDVPEIYGDPAIIMKDIYMPTNVKKTHKYGLIMHKNGSKFFNDTDKLDGTYKFIDIKTCDYKKFIDDIVSVDYVISSSLHGIILAETYGVPAILVEPEYSLFKYHDWYYATGRNEFPVIKSLEEVNTEKFLPVPDLEKIRENVKNAFPYDLYE